MRARTMTRRTLLGGSASIAVTELVGSPALAAPSVALPLQGAILAKALKYDQALRGRSAKVVILARNTNEAVRSISTAFRKLNTQVRVVPPGGFSAQQAAWADAAYVFAGQYSRGIDAAFTTHGVLSMVESVSLVESGQATIAVSVADSKPQLVINVTRMRLERHRFSSRLLKLARVIR